MLPHPAHAPAPERFCVCDEGLVPWCDQHGMPSRAYAAGMAAGARQLEAAAGRTTDLRTAACLRDVARGLRALAAL